MCDLDFPYLEPLPIFYGICFPILEWNVKTAKIRRKHFTDSGHCSTYLQSQHQGGWGRGMILKPPGVIQPTQWDLFSKQKNREEIQWQDNDKRGICIPKRRLGLRSRAAAPIKVKSQQRKYLKSPVISWLPTPPSGHTGSCSSIAPKALLGNGHATLLPGSLVAAL